jgi:hypothetical protein
VRDSEVDGFLERSAPDDVRDTMGWLSAGGYLLKSHLGDGSLGAEFVYAVAVEVIITVDRSQWMLEIALRLRRRPLAVRPVGGRTCGAPLQRSLPPELLGFWKVNGSGTSCQTE